MTTLDTIFLGILVGLVGLSYVLLSVFILVCIKAVNSVRRVVAKAENVVDSVESAAEILKESSGKFGLFKLIKNIIDIADSTHSKKK